MKMVIVPGSDSIHVAYRRSGSSRHDFRKTACLLEVNDTDDPFVRTPSLPTCAFCIRDGNMPEEIRIELWNKLMSA